MMAPSFKGGKYEGGTGVGLVLGKAKNCHEERGGGLRGLGVTARLKMFSF